MTICPALGVASTNTSGPGHELNQKHRFKPALRFVWHSAYEDEERVKELADAILSELEKKGDPAPAAAASLKTLLEEYEDLTGEPFEPQSPPS